MHERIKRLRKTLDLTQQEFANKIGVKRNTVGQYEIGRNEPTVTVISLICKEFNVNEEWLRNGTGEMFKVLPNNALDALVEKYNLTHNDYILIEKFINLKADKRAAIVDFVLEAASALSADDTSPNTKAYSNTNSKEISIDERVEDYRRQLELQEKAMEKSSVLRKNA